MAFVEIKDYAMWIKHIHNDDAGLKNKLVSMKEGAVIELEVDGFRGAWVKMSDGKDGRPTPGIKAIGKAREHWHEMQRRRGEIVSIKVT